MRKLSGDQKRRDAILRRFISKNRALWALLVSAIRGKIGRFVLLAFVAALPGYVSKARAQIILDEVNGAGSAIDVSVQTYDGNEVSSLGGGGAAPSGEFNATLPDDPSFTSSVSYNLSSSSLQFSTAQIVGTTGGSPGGPSSQFDFEIFFTVPVETAFTISGSYSFDPENRVQLNVALTDETIQDQIFQAGEMTGFPGYIGTPFGTDGSGFLQPGDEYQFTGEYLIYGGNEASGTGTLALDVSAVPEPASAGILAVAGIGLLIRRWRN
jgi:hypothetical protein